MIITSTNVIWCATALVESSPNFETPAPVSYSPSSPVFILSSFFLSPLNSEMNVLSPWIAFPLKKAGRRKRGGKQLTLMPRESPHMRIFINLLSRWTVLRHHLLLRAITGPPLSLFQLKMSHVLLTSGPLGTSRHTGRGVEPHASSGCI